MRKESIIINGSYGEGGGQILRSSLALSIITGRPIRITDIRANRPNPGLAAEHLTAVLAAAEICDAAVDGVKLDSTEISFTPGAPARAARYSWDVGAARPEGSAGAATLILHTVYPPLALANGITHMRISGGTHVAWSPTADYLMDVWAPMQALIGPAATVTLTKWGWYPAGGGEIAAAIASPDNARFRPLTLTGRGPLTRISGRAVGQNRPQEFAHQIADYARTRLAPLAVETEITPLTLSGNGIASGLFLTAEYSNCRAGFSAIEKPDSPPDTSQLAAQATDALLSHHRSQATFDQHLADQLLLPLALSDGPSRITVEKTSGHLQTQAKLLEYFDLATIAFRQQENRPLELTIRPRGATV